MIRRYLYLRRLRKHIYQREEDIEEYRLARLKGLLSYAYKNVPYYRRTWKEEGFHPSQVGSLSDIVQVPITSKEYLRSNYEDFIAQPYRPYYEQDRYYLAETAGSTGPSIPILKDRRCQDFQRAVAYRAFLLYGASLSDVKVLSTPQASEMRGGVLNALFNNHYLHPAECSSKLVEDIDPDIISLQPSTLGELLYTDIDISPEFIQTAGEILDSERKEEAEKRFDTVVHDIYGSSEAGEIAWRCPVDPEHYHINSELAVLETVDEEGDQVWDEYGDAVFTNLSNYYLPLIRLSIGDSIKIRRQSPCRFPFPEVTGIRGRTGIFALSGGERVYGRDVKEAFHAITGLKHVQVIANSEPYEVIVDVESSQSADEVLRSARKVAENLFDTPFTVTEQELQSDSDDKILPLVN
ncbi:MAG: hypothetical protein MUP63_02585 [Candidatus Nanohaloarchaeota archaeon QJJ-7]|nr:hypothetical protein [Candidatus Nanohaloarchaeota archaeon QJJ-7]